MNQRFLPTIKICQHYSDPELIALWQRGNERAFDCLYKRYVVALLKVAAQKVLSQDTAKELVQEVFLNVYLRRDKLQPTRSLQSYLFVALRNKIYNHYNKQLSRLKFENETLTNNHIVTHNLQADYEAKELREQLHEKINTLPPQCRKVFLMSREEQLTHKEIAEQLNISANTVDQHIQKALHFLRASFGGMLMMEVWMRDFGSNIV